MWQELVGQTKGDAKALGGRRVRLDATNVGIQGMQGAEAVGSTLYGLELSNIELSEARRLGVVSPEARSGQDQCGNAYENEKRSLLRIRLICDHGGTFCAPGGTQLPSLMEIGLSLGQYIRNVRLKSPSGAGNQFDSLSLPGEAF